MSDANNKNADVLADDMHSPDTGMEVSARRQKNRKTWLRRLAIAVACAGIASVGYYYLVGRNWVSTDNAYVNAESAQVTPLVAGEVIEVLVHDTQAVKRGDILLKIDPANANIAVAQAEANLAEAQRRFRQAIANSQALGAQVLARGADIAQADAQVVAAQADVEKTRAELDRRSALGSSGAVSREEVATARKAYIAAQAALASARAAVTQAQASRVASEGQLAANDALVKGSTEATDPTVMAAQAKLDAARLDRARTVIRAPIDGVITRRQVQLGQQVVSGQAVMMVVPISQVYVDANFKERDLAHVRAGMPAKVTTDLYGSSVIFTGKVVGFSGGTGASMALIPAQNATGNWIKVVQRLPVRIALDAKELKEHPLRVGLSSEVEIHLVDQ